MKIVKTRDVKTPSRGTPGSVGIDFYIPEDFKPTKVWPGKDILIPSGVIARVPTGYGLVAMNKSGIATKQNLIYGAQLVDPDYTGEIHLHVINVGDKVVDILPGQKLLQFALIPVSFEDVEVVEKLDDIKTERKDGGFGSTGLQ